MSAAEDYHHAYDNRFRMGALGAQDVEMLCLKADKLERVLEALESLEALDEKQVPTLLREFLREFGRLA